MNIIKKHHKFLIFIIVCITIYCIYIYSPTKNTIYTSIGDSYAEGINNYNVKSYGYTEYIRDYLNKKKILKSDYLYAKKDYMINDLYNDILLNRDQIKMNLRKTNILTINIGLNDILLEKQLNNNENYIKKIENDYKNLIKEIKKYCKGKIYIIGYVNFYPQESVEKSILDKYNNFCQQLSVEENIFYVDNKNIENDTYIDKKEIIYPSQKGYEQIYKNFRKIYK